MKIEEGRTVHGYGFNKNYITTDIPISRFFFTFQGNICIPEQDCLFRKFTPD